MAPLKKLKMKNLWRHALPLLVLAALLSGCGEKETRKITVFSTRQESLIRPALDAFARKHGVQIECVCEDAGALLIKIVAEGATSRADVFLATDVGDLCAASQHGVLKPLASESLEGSIPAHLRDPGNEWFAISKRARVIAYNNEKIKPEFLASYADLADPKWKGRLLLPAARTEGNPSMVALLIADHGEARTETILKGWLANLAAAGFADGAALLQALVAGQGDVGIVDSSDFLRFMEKVPDAPLAIFWPDQNGGGACVNICGAGITRFAHNEADAVALIEWLATSEGQRIFADTNNELTASANILYSHMPKTSNTPLAQAGENQKQALILMDRAGYK